ncbi:histidine kinase [Flavobacteriaceae bacterium TP-CH-4]|uniref:Histidine kinase n=1 Tax=Pelagihabitans pacificus TaxID=2696054 RepID=A0A967AR24_9FLAO|nr:sensor histidine kinase [Pelagihabitans pacificus]NHF58733.1 histidine kinase [Pelagihabitans pacificus]
MAKQLVSKKGLHKFGFRLLVVVLIFFGVKLTIDHGEQDALFDAASIFYFSTAFFQVMFTWELHDWLVKRQLKKPNGLDLPGSLKTLGLTLLFLAPTAAILYYMGLYELDDICQIPAEDKALQFRVDWMRAMVVGCAIMVFNLLYFSGKQKKDLELKMNELQNEVLTSKYKSLKNQISPHFLFNSLNTLTSLMYEDRDLASDFVTRLASTYRYILDNKEEDVVSLEKELNFLDSFIFMMNVRHTDSIIIKTTIGVDAAEYAIPTLSLQMLVENAMKHNYFSNERPMHINVYTVGKIALVVENTLRKRKLEEASTQVGIKNIQKRYAFYTHQEVAVEVDGATFKVTMPLLGKDAVTRPVLSVS